MEFKKNQKTYERQFEKIQEGIFDKNLPNDGYRDLRIKLIEDYNTLKVLHSDYKLDLEFSLRLYSFLQNALNAKESFFKESYYSNYNFWKFISLFVIPEIVADRWGCNKDHFYGKGVRIYPFTLYWYIHLSWQGNESATRAILEDFSTDQILQLVERPTRYGLNLGMYRCIMAKYSKIPKKDRTIQKNGKNVNLFRAIMLTLSSKLCLFKPELYPGGVTKFVDMIFEKASK